MAVKIRLRRMGAKRAPFYRVIVADSKSPRDGKFIEELGTYDPMKDPAEIKIDVEKAQQWIQNGAQPTTPQKRFSSSAARLNNREVFCFGRTSQKYRKRACR